MEQLTLFRSAISPITIIRRFEYRPMPSSTTTSYAGKGVVRYQLAGFREGAFAHTAATAGMAHDTRREIASQRHGRREPG